MERLTKLLSNQKYSTLFLCTLISLLIGQAVRGQDDTYKKRDWQSKFSIGFEFGVSFPEITGEPSLEIQSFSSGPEQKNTLNQYNAYWERISSKPYVAMGLYYKIKPRLDLGVEAQYRWNYPFTARQFFWLDEQVAANNLRVTSAGIFQQESSISNTLLGVVLNYRVFKTNFTSTIGVAFEAGLGGGLSLFQHKTEVPYVYLRMTTENALASGDYVLGPGNIAPVVQYSTAVYWQFNAGFRFSSFSFPDIKFGFRLTSMGSLVLKEQPASSQQLFVLSTTNSGSPDQNLVLAATNATRHLRSIDFFTRIYLW